MSSGYNMDTTTRLCDHCRQRFSVKTNVTIARCLGCHPKPWNQQINSSSSGIHHFAAKGIMPLDRMKKSIYREPSHQESLNTEPSSRSLISLEPRNQQTILSSSSGNHHVCSKECLHHNLMEKYTRNEATSKKYYYVSLNKEPSPLISPRLPKKRAVLCGVSYNKGKLRLKGTINDVRNMRDLLINSFKFQMEGILVLTEEENSPIYHPTRKNIENALQWLVKDCERGESLVFYFSGHGLRQPDFEDDETDGFDETICPTDFLKEGMIPDNYINSTIVKPLKEGVTLHAVVDACNSGTILDLEHVYNRDLKKWKDNRSPSGAKKATTGGLAICLSACEDSQLASDTTAFTRRTMNGVLTYILTEIVKQHPELTYGDLLDLIYERIEQVKKTDCLVNSNFFKRFFRDRLSQRPLFSASTEFDVYRKHFIL